MLYILILLPAGYCPEPEPAGQKRARPCRIRPFTTPAPLPGNSLRKGQYDIACTNYIGSLDASKILVA